MPHAPGHDSPSLQTYMRIGEMVPRSRSMVRDCLHVDDVLISGDLITLSFRRFKHSSLQSPQSLQIQGACSPGPSIYVAAFLRDFLRARRAKQALLLAYPNGSPMLRREFDVALKQLLIFCGYQTSAFKGYSFRIGAATDIRCVPAIYSHCLTFSCFCILFAIHVTLVLLVGRSHLAR